MSVGYKYSEVIAKKVREGVRNGVSIKVIMASIQKYPEAPRSSTTFYKIYGQDISEVKADINGKVGSVVIQKALEGDLKAAELFLRARGDWSPNSTVNEVEQTTDPDEDTSAIDSLMTLLGKDKPDNGPTTNKDNG